MAIILNFEIADEYIDDIRGWVDGLHGAPQTAAQTKEFIKQFFNDQLKKNIISWRKSKRAAEIETEITLDKSFGITDAQ